jgi:dTDP-4-amino-4,6-dideoxygalactose transaminase
MKNDSMAKAREVGKNYAERMNKISILTAIGMRGLERFATFMSTRQVVNVYSKLPEKLMPANIPAGPAYAQHPYHLSWRSAVKERGRPHA